MLGFAAVSAIAKPNGIAAAAQQRSVAADTQLSLEAEPLVAEPQPQPREPPRAGAAPNVGSPPRLGAPLGGGDLARQEAQSITLAPAQPQKLPSSLQASDQKQASLIISSSPKSLEEAIGVLRDTPLTAKIKVTSALPLRTPRPQLVALQIQPIGTASAPRVPEPLQMGAPLRWGLPPKLAPLRGNMSPADTESSQRE